MPLIAALEQVRRRKGEIQVQNLLKALAAVRSSQPQNRMGRTNKAVSRMQEQMQQLVSQMQSDAPDATQHAPAQKPQTSRLKTSPAEENTTGGNEPVNGEIGEGANEN